MTQRFLVARDNKLFVAAYWATKLLLAVGLFFEGMYPTGFYWNFIGYYQLPLTLLLIPIIKSIWTKSM